MTLSLTVNETLKRLSSLPSRGNSGGDSVAIGIYIISLSPHLRTPLFPVPNKPCGQLCFVCFVCALCVLCVCFVCVCVCVFCFFLSLQILFSSVSAVYFLCLCYCEMLVTVFF